MIKVLKVAVKTLVLAICFTSSLSQSMANNINELTYMCNDCHGENGVSSDSDIPTIAGFSETSINDTLFAFIDNTRPAITGKFRHGDTSRSETDMITIAKNLTEDEIALLASYYAEQTFVAAKQAFDPKLAEQGRKIHEMRCTKCHDEGGSLADDDASILAGQWMSYLNTSFKDYRQKKRESERGMLTKIYALSEEQVQALIHYYASQQ
jgi:sulfide dehydrogenase cytochrome subunit